MDPTLIYHITHVDNLPYILEADGLWCKAEQEERDITYRNIAHQGIQDRRAKTIVPCGPGGTLHEYVPFYFAPRSPMLGAIHVGRVGGYEEGQHKIVHLVSSVEKVQISGVPFVFTDGHATVRLSSFFVDPADLREIDWRIMKDKYWRDTPEDLDRMRRRQAEFLVRSHCPLGCFLGLAVFDAEMKQQVQETLEIHETPMPAVVRRGWYY